MAFFVAHQGGWDEILFVLAPLLLFAGLLAAARRRVDQMEDGDTDPAAPTTTLDEPTGDDGA
jgi:hypothetical protein